MDESEAMDRLDHQVLTRYTGSDSTDAVIRQRMSFNERERRSYLVVARNHGAYPHHYKEYIHNGIIVEERVVQKSALLWGYERHQELPPYPHPYASALLNGVICFERNRCISEVKELLYSLSIDHRRFLFALEFAQLIQCHWNMKPLIRNQQMRDAFRWGLAALNHWGVLAVVEHGFYPDEVSLWEQVRVANPEVFRFYQEFVSGEEKLTKRIELVHLAFEFLIRSKSRFYCDYVIEMVRSCQPATCEHLIHHATPSSLRSILPLLLRVLVEQKILVEVYEKDSPQAGCEQIYYNIGG